MAGMALHAMVPEEKSSANREVPSIFMRGIPQADLAAPPPATARGRETSAAARRRSMEGMTFKGARTAGVAGG
jgi:hypothetical protein